GISDFQFGIKKFGDMGELKLVSPQSSDVIRERGREFDTRQSVGGIVKICAGGTIVVLVGIVREGGQVLAQAQLQFAMVVVRRKPFVAVIFVRVEPKIHVGIFAVKQ